MQLRFDQRGQPLPLRLRRDAPLRRAPLRLEAPSGPATSRGAPSPRRFSASETHGETHGETQRSAAEGGVSPEAQWERLAALVEAQLHVRPSAEQVARCTRDSHHGCALSLGGEG